MKRTVAASALAGLALLVGTTAAAAGTTSYTMNWSTSVSSGYTVDGVKVTTKLLGGATLYSTPTGPWIGTAAANDAEIHFDAPVKEFCVYIWWNNTGEQVNITTNQTAGNVYTAIDTGGVTTTVSGNAFTWNAMADADESAMCVSNDSGISRITYDHNGTGSGLVFGDKVLFGSGPSCTKVTWYKDADGDGYGDPDTTALECLKPTGFVAGADDCDDADKLTYPDATEVVGDEKDQSCDGRETCYVDADDDGYRVTSTVVSTDSDCVDPGEAKASEPVGDCHDEDKSINPGATEVAYDGIDQDCSGEDLCDVDDDGFDHPLCGGSDCNDVATLVNPAVEETWYDGVDADCDGWSDYDADFDGFDSADYEGSDCDDEDDAIHPDAEEIWYDGVDQNCDESSDYDADGDGYDASTWGGEDCDDDADWVYPGAEEVDDGIDNDCNGLSEDDDLDRDGVLDEDELDLGLDPNSRDSDGDGVPDADELVDGEAIDTDKDGIIDALDTDDDGDGIPTADERGPAKYPLDSDKDGVPDYLDTDSDNDGFDDAIEGNVDSDYDGVPDRIDVDSDEDSVLDAEELDADSDGDGVDDRLDLDDDGDGFSTEEEESWASTDLDGDGVDNYLDDDADGDGTADVDEGWGDDDCDDVPNVQDSDDLDGPCLNPPSETFQNKACSSTGLPVGGASLVLFGLIGLVRRRR